MPVSTRRATGALIMLSVATFGYVTNEVLPIGLLTVMADDLGRSRSEIGLLVTGYAVVVVLASIPLTRLTYRLPRRPVLASTLGLSAAATLLAAVAPTYQVLLTARLLTALTQALFWSIVAPTATALFRPEVRGRVVARLSIGAALAPVLGIPAGTWLGEQAGWRTPFAVMTGIGLLTCIGIAVLLPTVASQNSGSTRGSSPDARRYAILVISSAIGVAGFLTANTYVTPFLLDIGGFSAAALGPVLLAAGLGGLAGTLLVGAILDRHPWAAVVSPLALITTALLGLFAFGHHQAPTVALLATTGLAYSALAVAIQNRALQVAPGSTDIASAGSSSAFNVGIAAGALLGGVLVDSIGVRSVALAGGLLTTLALAGMLTEPWVARRRPVVVAECGHDRPARQVCEEAA